MDKDQLEDSELLETSFEENQIIVKYLFIYFFKFLINLIVISLIYF